MTLKIHGLDLCCSIVHFLITSFTMDDTKEEKFFVQENVFSSLFEKKGGRPVLKLQSKFVQFPVKRSTPLNNRRRRGGKEIFVLFEEQLASVPLKKLHVKRFLTNVKNKCENSYSVTISTSLFYKLGVQHS